MRRNIRLTENQLHRVIKESVKKIIKEGFGNQLKSAFNGAVNGFQNQRRSDNAISDSDVIDAAKWVGKQAQTAISFMQQNDYGAGYEALEQAQTFIQKAMQGINVISTEQQQMDDNGQLGFGTNRTSKIVPNGERINQSNMSWSNPQSPNTKAPFNQYQQNYGNMTYPQNNGF
jgi:hypothetical protein